jgi:hypothetical protein
MKRYCFIEGCENEIGPRSKSDTCKTCKSSLRYWDDRPHGDIFEYQQKLAVRSARMATITGKRRRSIASVRTARSAQVEARH